MTEEIIGSKTSEARSQVSNKLAFATLLRGLAIQDEQVEMIVDDLKEIRRRIKRQHVGKGLSLKRLAAIAFNFTE